MSLGMQFWMYTEFGLLAGCCSSYLFVVMEAFSGKVVAVLLRLALRKPALVLEGHVQKLWQGVLLLQNFQMA